MNNRHKGLPFAATLALLVSGCAEAPTDPAARSLDGALDRVNAAAAAHVLEGSFELVPPIYDIAAMPNGGIAFAQHNVVMEIGRNGIREVNAVPTVEGSAINGLAPTGQGHFLAASGGLDLTVGAGMWQVTRGNARMIADIGAFELVDDTDATAGPQWKDPRCEGIDGFTEGPQSNPYHLSALSGSEALVADAAGNTLRYTKSNGEVDWVAVFTPPLDEAGDYMVRWVHEDGIDCYVQPVPTSVAVGPDGDYYVGELTGNLTENDVLVDPDDLADAVNGLSRVWRIDGGARNVVCPSDACTVAISGLTAVIDLEFGPDGMLYVVENDQNGWFLPLLGFAAGGTIRSCDVNTGACTVVEDGLVIPGAIAFDSWGELWVLENGIGADPIVRRVAIP